MVRIVRERVATWLHRSGVIEAVAWARARSALPNLAIVTYHHIADDDPASPFDRSIPDASPAQFRRQLELLARHMTPVTLDDVLAALDGGRLPKNPVMVSFDDGYRSCADVALPILQDVGIPATFFIATSFVHDRTLYWWERIAVLLHLAAVERATLDYPVPLTFSPFEARIQKRLCDLVKNTPNLDVERYTDGLARALRVEWSLERERTYAERLVMTWDQVRQLAAAGMHIGSHTKRHRVLQTLDDGSLVDELGGSRAELEARIGKPVRAIAYPVGRAVAKDPRIRRALQATGYKAGFSNMSGVNTAWSREVDPFDIRRLTTYVEMTDAMFLTQIVLPRFAYVFPGN